MTRKTKARLDEEVRRLLSPTSSRRATRTGVAIRAGSTPRAGVYLALGGDGEPWPPWLIDLQDTSGAYVIRDAATRRPLYAGSAKSNLYSTITRHFQQWRRRKKWWKGQYGAGHDPGLVYDRSRCEVAIWVTAEERRLEKEAQLILKLHPRDNLVEHPDGELEEAPF